VRSPGAAEPRLPLPIAGATRQPAPAEYKPHILADGQQMMAVAYAIKDGSFNCEKPRIWSERLLGPYRRSAEFRRQSGWPATGCAAASRPDDEQSPNHVTFLLNFFDEVRRREVAAGK
jgi:hypothetical protein